MQMSRMTFPKKTMGQVVWNGCVGQRYYPDHLLTSTRTQRKQCYG